MASSTGLHRGSDVKFGIFLAILTFYLFSKAKSLSCNKCESNKSWEHCDANSANEECTINDARCVQYNYEFTKTSPSQQETKFGRRCLPQSECSSSLFPACKSLAEDAQEDDNVKLTCHVSCCGEDLCNSNVKLNSSFLVLAIMLLISAFLISF